MDTSHLAFLTIGAFGLSLPLLVVGIASILLHTSRQGKPGDQEGKSFPVKGLIATGPGIGVLFAACVIGADSSSFSVVSLIAALLGILIIAVVGVVAYQDRARRGEDSENPELPSVNGELKGAASESTTSLSGKIWDWIRIVGAASLHSIVIGVIGVLMGTIPLMLVGIPFFVALFFGTCLGLLFSTIIFCCDLRDVKVRFDRTGIVAAPKRFIPRGLLSSQSREPGNNTSQALGRRRILDPWPGPRSKYSREDYRRYGATDADIDFWGLDEPGAPPPEAAGWAVWEALEEMEGGPDDMDFDLDFDIDLY
jgi:hypothetical protein